jgi:hypothetical protein
VIIFISRLFFASDSKEVATMASSYGLPHLRKPRTGVEGTGLAWFSRPYPALPYRYVMGQYPRDEVYTMYSLEPQQRALYEQRAVTLLGNQTTQRQTQWLFPNTPPTVDSTPPLQHGSHYRDRSTTDKVPRPHVVAMHGTFPHTPDIYRQGSISPWNDQTGLDTGN